MPFLVFRYSYSTLHERCVPTTQTLYIHSRKRGIVLFTSFDDCILESLVDTFVAIGETSLVCWCSNSNPHGCSLDESTTDHKDLLSCFTVSPTGQPKHPVEVNPLLPLACPAPHRARHSHVTFLFSCTFFFRRPFSLLQQSMFAHPGSRDHNELDSSLVWGPSETQCCFFLPLALSTLNRAEHTT